MPLYSFTIRVTGISTDHDYYEDALYNAGCTDALVAIVDGDLSIDFDRQAQSYDLPVQSATQAVQRAGGRVVAIDRTA
jgi:hypothetical protein